MSSRKKKSASVAAAGTASTRSASPAGRTKSTQQRTNNGKETNNNWSAQGNTHTGRHKLDDHARLCGAFTRSRCPCHCIRSLPLAHCVFSPSARAFLLSFRGWGRPVPPPASRDVFAYEQCPWKLIAFLTVACAAASTYFTVGLTLWAILTVPIFGALFALPMLAAVLLPLSWRLDPAGEGNPEKYFIFHDKGQSTASTLCILARVSCWGSRSLEFVPLFVSVSPAFERKWRGQRVPVEELYEAYFDEKISLIDGDQSLLDVLYQRHEFARSILTASHVKFFLLQFIPELLKHTRFQDITQVREHYDRSGDTPYTRARRSLLPRACSAATTPLLPHHYHRQSPSAASLFPPP
jgi:hypothetical protein